jgi:hypothetical protein
MMRCRTQFELATLIRVQNLSQAATDFRKKWHNWDLYRIIMNATVKFKYENIKLEKKKCDAVHASHLNYTIKS